MTISGRVHPSDPLTFYEHLSRCQDMTEFEELSKVVQRAFMVDGIPGYTATKGPGTRTHCPLPDECTIVLLKGSVRLDDENEDITERYVGLQARGSKTLTALSDSTVIWFPSVCCWDTSKCSFAREGQCRRNPGVVIPRDPKNPMWWEAESPKPRRFWKGKTKADKRCVTS